MWILRHLRKGGKWSKASLVACWCLLLATVSLPLSADGDQSLGSLGRALIPEEGEDKNYNSTVLSIEQLSECIALYREVPEVEKKLLSLQERVDVSSGILDELIRKLDSLKPYLETHQDQKFTNKEEVDAYNFQVDKFNGLNRQYSKQVEKYKVLEAAYNGLVNEYAMLVSIHQDNCEGRDYYRDDMLSVSASLGEALLKGVR